MENYIWLIAFLPLLVVFLINSYIQRSEAQRRIIRTKKQKQKGQASMSEAFNRFIGKQVVIYTSNSTIIGTVQAVEEGWVVLQPDKGQPGETEMINQDYISRIRDYPLNSKGKKKTIVS